MVANGWWMEDGWYLFSSDPIKRHLGAHVIVESAMRVMGHDLLTGALALAHGLQGSIPMEQLEHGHQLLKLEHRPSFVGLQHEPEGSDARVGIIRLVRIPLVNNKDRYSISSSITF